jgi:hypothetical protein
MELGESIAGRAHSAVNLAGFTAQIEQEGKKDPCDRPLGPRYRH